MLDSNRLVCQWYRLQAHESQTPVDGQQYKTVMLFLYVKKKQNLNKIPKNRLCENFFDVEIP